MCDRVNLKEKEVAQFIEGMLVNSISHTKIILIEYSVNRTQDRTMNNTRKTAINL